MVTLLRQILQKFPHPGFHRRPVLFQLPLKKCSRIPFKCVKRKILSVSVQKKFSAVPLIQSHTSQGGLSHIAEPPGIRRGFPCVHIQTLRVKQHAVHVKYHRAAPVISFVSRAVCPLLYLSHHFCSHQRFFSLYHQNLSM